MVTEVLISQIRDILAAFIPSLAAILYCPVAEAP
jgi:hypothetical protein